MGIYDREYIRVGRRSGTGLASLGLISVNSWIIILNIAVFVIDPFLGQFARPVLVRQDIDPAMRGRALVIERPPAQLPLVGRSVPLVIYDRETGQAVGRRIYAVTPPMQAIGHFSTARAFVSFDPATNVVRANTEIWRFITFQFLHGSVTHIAFNMLGLWMFGGMVEQYLGGKRYAAFYLACGIFGALSYLILNFMGSQLGIRLPGVLPDSPYTPLVGASAGVFGVIMACAKIAPNAIVQLLFPPIPMKLKLMAYGYVALATFNLLRGGHNAGGDAAHVGGAIAGAFFIRNAHLLRDFFDVFGRRSTSPAPPSRDEIDRLLEKVSSKGLASLSESEKQMLRRESARRRSFDA
ncbi:MAG: rhomboid family intramembrane serine protease [Phycisphaerales bacterium]